MYRYIYIKQAQLTVSICFNHFFCAFLMRAIVVACSWARGNHSSLDFTFRQPVRCQDIYIYTYFCCVIYQGPQLKHTNAYKIIQELLKPAIPDSPSMASMLSFHGIMIGIGCFFWRGGVQGALALAARPQVGRTSVWAAEDSWAAGLRWFCGANAVFRRYTRYIQVIPSVHAG